MEMELWEIILYIYLSIHRLEYRQRFFFFHNVEISCGNSILD